MSRQTVPEAAAPSPSTGSTQPAPPFPRTVAGAAKAKGRGERSHETRASGEPVASVPESDAGELLDHAAKRAYRERVGELEGEIAEAERHADAGRVAKLREEREALFAELARAVGLGGRARKAGSATERARVNVQRRLRDAIAKITEADAELGRFFERSIRTGTFCCFRPPATMG